jgi:hypothetical protein
MTDTTNPQAADPRQPAYDAVFAYIREQPRDFVPTTVVDRNAMIWRAVHAALDAVGVPGTASAPTDQAACPDPIECSHEAALGETRARVERLALTFEVSGNEFIAERIREALGGESAAVPVPPVDRCIHVKAIHDTHHRTPVTGCPWCTATEKAAGDPS